MWTARSKQLRWLRDSHTKGLLVSDVHMGQKDMQNDLTSHHQLTQRKKTDSEFKMRLGDLLRTPSPGEENQEHPRPGSGRARHMGPFPPTAVAR